MADDLIKRLRSQKAVDGRPHEIEQLTDEAADLIEQQAAEIVNLKHDIERHIANHAADLNAVAPAVDAQPVAWRHKATKILRNDSIAKGADFEPDDWEPLYASPQSEGLRKALTEIAEQEHVELMLDPTWAQRIAIAALSQHTGEKDD